jgi:hypothetical protein
VTPERGLDSGGVQDPLATLDAIRRLDRHLADCDGPIARGIVSRAIRYLEDDLRLQLTGPRRPLRARDVIGPGVR